MTNRVNALLVVLDEDIREDDVQPLIDAISQLRHVIKVENNIASIENGIAENRVKYHLINKIYEVLK